MQEFTEGFKITEVKDKMIPYRWEVEYKVVPSLKQSDTIEGYTFEVIKDETKSGTFVKLKYETSAFDEMLPDRKNDFEYAEATIARRHQKVIYRLMLERMVYQQISHPISIEIISRPTLLNKEELISAGINKLRTLDKEFTMLRAILDVGDSIRESHEFWKSGFKGRVAGFADDTLRVADWLQRSETEQDSIQSFILAWISFNGLYGLFASINGLSTCDDATKFEKMISGLIKEVDAEQIVNTHAEELNLLESYNIKSDKGTENWSDRLKAERLNPKDSNMAILKYAARCIYGVRKQVFHEVPEPDNIIGRAKNAKLILMPIALTCLKNFVKYE